MSEPWPKHEVITLKLKNGNELVMRKDAVLTIEYDYGSRNLACKVNGIETESGYDFIVSELGWRCKDRSLI